MKNIFLILLSALFLTACGGPSPSEINSLDYGKKPRNISTKEIKKYVSFLKDPDSAKIKIVKQPTKKGYIIDQNGNVIWSGWVATVKVNGKNSYGGYTGYKTYYAAVDKIGFIVGLYGITGVEALSMYSGTNFLNIVNEKMYRI